MKTIFETKEQFFAMKAQWAASSKSPKCKSTLTPCDEWTNSDNRVSVGTGRTRHPGWMNAECHILYNLLRNKPSDHGFTPSTNPNKIISKPDAHKTGLESLQALQTQLKTNGRFKPKGFLKRMRFEAIQVIDRRPRHGQRMKSTMEHVNRVLAPFGDTLTIEMFLEIDFPKIEEKKPQPTQPTQPIESVDLNVFSLV